MQIADRLLKTPPYPFAELARLKQFEWHYDGRDGATYGHPFLLFKFRP